MKLPKTKALTFDQMDGVIQSICKVEGKPFAWWLSPNTAFDGRKPYELLSTPDQEELEKYIRNLVAR